MVEVKNVTKSSAELKTEFCAAKSLVMDELYCINRNIDNKIITEQCDEKNVLQKKQSIAKKSKFISFSWTF